MINGIEDRQISPILASGTAACITNKLKPNGGVIGLISKFIRKITQNHMTLKSIAETRGMKIGRHIIIIGIAPRNIPKIKTTICIAMIISRGETVKLVAISTSPLLAPLKASIWLKAVDPAIIKNIIPVELS